MSRQELVDALTMHLLKSIGGSPLAVEVAANEAIAFLSTKSYGPRNSVIELCAEAIESGDMDSEMSGYAWHFAKVVRALKDQSGLP